MNGVGFLAHLTMARHACAKLPTLAPLIYDTWHNWQKSEHLICDTHHEEKACMAPIS